MTLCAEQLAQKVRNECWDGSFPVNPVMIAERLNLNVYEMSFEDEIAGAFINHKERGPIIFVSNNDPVSRKRFTVAHEIGHFIHAREDGNLNNFEIIDFRGKLSDVNNDSKEVFANQFAASLLMPTDEVKRLVKSKTITELADYFFVSKEAMSYRLLNVM